MKPTLEFARHELEQLVAETKRNSVLMTTEEIQVMLEDAISMERERCARILEKHRLNHSAAILRGHK